MSPRGTLEEYIAKQEAAIAAAKQRAANKRKNRMFVIVDKIDALRQRQAKLEDQITVLNEELTALVEEGETLDSILATRGEDENA